MSKLDRRNQFTGKFSPPQSCDKYLWHKVEGQPICSPLASINQLTALSPALAGRCGNPGDTVFRWRAGCCGDRRWASVSGDDVTSEVVTSALPGLLNCSVLWLDDWTVTGIVKVWGGAVDCYKAERDFLAYVIPQQLISKSLRHLIRVPCTY